MNRTIKCLKRLQKRSMDDNLRQLVLIRQDHVLVNYSTCFFTSDSGFFLIHFSKKMGRSGDGKRRSKIFSAANATSKMSFGKF